MYDCAGHENPYGTKIARPVCVLHNGKLNMYYVYAE